VALALFFVRLLNNPESLLERGHRPRTGNAWHPETVKHLLSAKALNIPETAR
jgi:hypothetical protein